MSIIRSHRFFHIAKNPYFERLAFKPNLADYDVCLWDLYRLFLYVAERSIAHLSPSERQRKTAEVLNTDRDAMAVYIGHSALRLLANEKRIRAERPVEWAQPNRTISFDR